MSNEGSEGPVISRRDFLKKVGEGVAAVAFVGIDGNKQPPIGTPEGVRQNDTYGEAAFGNGVSAAEALKIATAEYAKKTNPGLSDEEARKIAENSYNERIETSSCPTCNIIVMDESGIYMVNHWTAMYNHVNDGDSRTLVSEEINNKFSESGIMYYFNTFTEASGLLQGFKDNNFPAKFDEMGNDGQIRAFYNQDAYIETGVVQ